MKQNWRYKAWNFHIPFPLLSSSSSVIRINCIYQKHTKSYPQQQILLCILAHCHNNNFEDSIHAKMAYRYSPAEREALQERASTATAAGLAEARDYLMQSLTQLRLPYAFMGGYSLVLRQSPRPTQDLDIAVQANMQQIRQFVDGQARSVYAGSLMVHPTDAQCQTHGPKWSSFRRHSNFCEMWTYSKRAC